MNATTIKALAVAQLAVLGSATALAQNAHEIVGYNALKARLGPATPLGYSVATGQVEGKKNQYGPNQSNSEFVGKAFILKSGPSSSDTHATTVGKNLYGNITSISNGVPVVYLWYPMDWVQNYLKSSSISTLLPDYPPDGLRVFNHSWALDGGAGFNNLALRRADWAMDNYGVLMVAGVVNPPYAFAPLMAGSYNGISVGLSNGNHVSGAMPSLHDGVGRRHPLIVAPSNLTSYATPIVGAAVSMLNDAAVSTPRLWGELDAQRPEVIKAALLAGTTRRTNWSNGPVTSGPERGVTTMPLDPHFGADLLNVDRAHWILGAGSQLGASHPDSADLVGRMGWERPMLAGGESRFYRLDVPADAEFLSVFATWNRTVATTFTTWSVADYDLVLWRVGDDGEMLSLVGDAGLGWFVAGNVVSASTIENHEQLFVRGLKAGEYMVELRRMDGGNAEPVAVAWYRSTDTEPGDLNEDGKVDGFDFGSVLMQWGTVDLKADVNGDGQVDVLDMSVTLLNWFASW